jgi:protein-S-isoprenylcysteine O-methyltransferase Ste14
MFDPHNWFPSPFFSNLFLILVLAAYLSDYMLVRLAERGRGDGSSRRGDSGSFLTIYGASLLALAFAVLCRFRGWGVATGLFQYLGLVVLVLGSLFRDWAIYRLGRFFSRVVEIEADHRLITDGPYRFIRHPAYTGMALINVGAVMALGSWIGAMATLVLILAATYYRIRVEEKLLLETFGDQYQQYMRHTWRLIPGW